MSREHEPNTSRSTHTAKRLHRCDHRGYGCQGSIEAGERYTRAVCFPAHDANGGKWPWVMRLCAVCAPLPATEDIA